MKIALDYDKTFTEKPAMWLSIAAVMKLNGCDVRIVTIRDRYLDRTEKLVELEEFLHVIYTGGVAKEWYCSHFTGGWVPDVWIDDKVRTIIENSTATPEGLVEWRSLRNEGPSFPLPHSEPPAPSAAERRAHVELSQDD